MQKKRAGSSGFLTCDAFAAFGVLWAAATLFHLAFQRLFFANYRCAALSVGALAVFWLPRKTLPLIFLAACQLAVLYAELPYVSNHWLFTGAINLILLSSAVWVCAARGLRVDNFREEVWRAFAPAARVSLIILYAFVVLHKLNWDFLDSQQSCATFLYGKIARAQPYFPNTLWAKEGAIWGTLIAEGAIPILLISARFRMLGVLVGLLLHFCFALLPEYFNFSSMMFAMLSLFVFADAGKEDQGPHVKNSSALRRSITLGGLAASAAAAIYFRKDLESGFAPVFFCSIWLFYGIGAVVFLMYAGRLRIDPRLPAKQVLKISPAFLWVFPVLLVFNGFCPYLGLKTDTSFAMYSNLRTEGETFNHLFIPRWVKLFSYQDDLVEIQNASQRRLRKYVKRRWLMNYLDLRTIAQRHRNGAVSYVRDGQLIVVPKISENAELSAPYAKWRQKFFHFRPVPQNGERFCHH
jgi:hypothetical protein